MKRKNYRTTKLFLLQEKTIKKCIFSFCIDKYEGRDARHSTMTKHGKLITTSYRIDF